MVPEQIRLGDAYGVVAAVVDQEYLDRQAVGQYRLQLLQIHHDAAVALEADRLPPAAADAGADGGGQGVAHAGCGAVVVQARAPLDDKGLVAHHAARAVGHRRQAVLGQAFGEVAHEGVYVGGLAVLRPVMGQHHGIVPLPAPAGFKPLPAAEHRGVRRRVQLRQKVLRVGPDRHFHVQRGFFQLALVDIHHDDLRRPGPGLPVVAHLPDGNARPHGEYEIGVLYRPVAGAVAHASGATTVQRVLVLDQIHGVPVGYHRYIQLFQ